MKAEDVLRYLEQNPGFFEDNADIVSTMTIPHPYSGRAISLTERQLLTLRETNRSLEKRLADLMHYGQTNDVISEKLHRLAVALVAADSYAKVRSLIYNYLLYDFNVQHPILRLWGPMASHKENEVLTISDIQKASILRMKEPFCGSVDHADSSLYGNEHAAKIHSQALIPLRALEGSEPFGVLALGSEDQKRFENDMEKLYLVRLGELASAAILRCLNH